MERADITVFNVTSQVKGVRLEVIPITAGELLRFELLYDLRANILDDLHLELCTVCAVVGGKQKSKRVGKVAQLRKLAERTQQPLVIRCVAAVQ